MPSILVVLITISLVILIHELGHFLVAKWVGVKVEEFGLGYPPRIIGKKIGETLYSINVLPFGGFVKLFGEQEADLRLKDKLAENLKHRAFFNKGKKKRLAVIAAGAVMNFVLGMVAFSFVYSWAGIPEKVDYLTIDAVMPNSPAAEVGLQAEDRILTIDGREVRQVDEFVKLMDEKKDQEITLELTAKQGREWNLEQRRTVAVTPRKDPPEGEGALGILISNFDNIYYPFWQMPFRGAWVGIQEAISWGLVIFLGIWTMLVQLFTQGIAPQVAGPVGIYRITAAVSQQGLLALMRFTGILSINLAVINILPFPALDGGRLVFIFLEKVIGRRIKPVIEQWINSIGIIILIGLMLAVTFREVLDLLRQFQSHF